MKFQALASIQTGVSMFSRVRKDADLEKTKQMVNLLLGDIEALFASVRSQISENAKAIEKSKEGHIAFGIQTNKLNELKAAVAANTANIATKIGEAPIDGRIYGRRNGVWQLLIIPDVFIDPRDEKIYRTVEIGNQTWMAENLNWAGAGVYYGSGTTPGVREPFPKAGRLYTWEEAQTVAPQGWHLPTDAEWTTMTNFIGGTTGGGFKLKATTSWNNNNGASGNGIDSFGFSVLAAGNRYIDSTFGDVGNSGLFWTATANTASNALYRHFLHNNVDLARYNADKAHSFSVRCVKD